MELKQYAVNGKTYTLILKQNLDGTWECAGFDPAMNEVIKAPGRVTKHDAQFAAHAALHELYSLRADQKCEEECERGWRPAIAAPS